MARHLRIRCTVKTGQTSPHERIHAVGGINPDGSRWTLTQEEAISQIEKGACVFYVESPVRQRFDLTVATDANGSKYLKTPTARDQPVKLLSLPACP
ncbi:MAG TPA: DUF3892 domain-containing protein [Candidatus Binatus sp.]|nr:DUF3892 domain-containing protein [Candidatus Binatus sp.]